MTRGMGWGSGVAAALVTVLLVSGCATQRTAPPAKQVPAAQSTPGYKIGKPYQIGGEWYYPAEDFSYSETGIASWYGNEFNGHATASGETFDPNALTAAHRTLPLPSMVRVTNLENGRAIALRINDR